MTAFLLLFILAGLTDINTITPLLVSMIGLGVGIFSLFIVTRFRQYLHDGLSPRDAAAEAGASAGRATIFAGLTVAISVTRARLLRARLRHEARDQVGSRRPHDRAHRELAAHRRPREAGSQGRPAESSVPAEVGRLGDCPRTNADRSLKSVVTAHAKPVFWTLLVLGVLLASTSALVRLGASDQEVRSQPNRPRGARAACSPRASGRASTARSRSSSTSTATPRAAAAGLRRRAGGSRCRVRERAAVQRSKSSVAIVFVTPDSAPQDVETEARRSSPFGRRPDGDRRR